MLWLNLYPWTLYHYRELKALKTFWHMDWATGFEVFHEACSYDFFVFNHLEDWSVHTSALLQHRTILSFWARNCSEKKGKRRRQNSEETVERLDRALRAEAYKLGCAIQQWRLFVNRMVNLVLCVEFSYDCRAECEEWMASVTKLTNGCSSSSLFLSRMQWHACFIVVQECVSSSSNVFL